MSKHLPIELANYCQLNKKYIIKLEEIDMDLSKSSGATECLLKISQDSDGVSFKFSDIKSGLCFMQINFTDKLWNCTAFFDEQGRDYVDLSDSPLFGKQSDNIIIEKTKKFTDLLMQLLDSKNVTSPHESYLTRLYKTVTSYLSFNLSTSVSKL